MMNQISIGETITCKACGHRVTATVNPETNLTVLIGLPLVRCIDGDDRHPWPPETTLPPTQEREDDGAD